MGIIIIMKSENSKTSMPHKLINLTDKMDLRRGAKERYISLKERQEIVDNLRQVIII